MYSLQANIGEIHLYEYVKVSDVGKNFLAGFDNVFLGIIDREAVEITVEFCLKELIPVLEA
jgi:hypothetical protein